MFDGIEIISILLCVLSLAMIIMGIKTREPAVVISFVLIAMLALLWSGIIRLPIPQTLIWMGVNISAILFIIQGLISLFTKSTESFLLKIPNRFSQLSKALISLLIGAGFAGMVILARF